jgi:hypothetical protein
MNSGAAHADADLLWFLHADSTLPNPSTLSVIIDTMLDPAILGGACRFRLRANDGFFKMIATLVNLRARILHRPYGDQGIFVRKKTFQQIGGYRDIASSDVDLALRIRERGDFVAISPIVETSARTWRQHGKIKTTIWHLKEWMSYEWTRHRRQPAGPPEPLERLEDTNSAPDGVAPASIHTPKSVQTVKIPESGT